ncbi:peptidoglycan-binding protein [Pedobacter deserti]|uniref:peptidoglycan-binding protein n=1 Tax=Pedobacter deserti TaxID=2817382 RepID=UPI00210ED3CB|nr:peptidoglycan-binding protein [Pedobacter sp. SYSU D00382]
MATAKFLLAFFCFALVGGSGMPGSSMLGKGTFEVATPHSRAGYWLGERLYGSFTPLSKPHVADAQQRKRVVEIACGELWVREASGKNDGPRVEGYLASVGLKKGQPWCAAFVSWVFKQAGYAKPRTGWSPALFPAARLAKAAAPGNVFGIYFPALKRVAHCGLVTDRRDSWIGTVEGNTNASGGREGDGVYRRLRHVRTVHCYADWIAAPRNGKGGGR